MFIIIIFSLLNIVLADIDAHKIEQGKVIKHGINGLIYLGLLGFAFFFTKDFWLLAVLCFDRLIFFNLSLNIFRKLPFLYVSKEPKSIVDKLALKVFGKNGGVMYLVYAVIFILLIVKIEL